jgi:hypothetical protein
MQKGKVMATPFCGPLYARNLMVKSFFIMISISGTIHASKVGTMSVSLLPQHLTHAR